ncbi:tetratricopeptide repeat protein [Pseudomonas matsuisoli]|uniref:Tetratricopeptide repeat-containing protein n=1 Tax=Pseudomonas matsuisoli TaxID=1515666 RepID=A0A917PZ24_9PSED|nr:tetratricopeptide repeat protein [Pseudomonas matsuisoli]GGJ99707.1 hypothetical protein GCM10009304_26880 [Pseudomonas matsuisoli]
MKKCLFTLALLALATGCSTNPRGSVPVVDAGAPLSSSQQGNANRGYSQAQPQRQAAPTPEESGVVVMVPQGASSAPLETFPANDSGFNAPAPAAQPVYTPSAAPGASSPTGIPSANAGTSAGSGLAADEQLDGPVLALLTTAQSLQSSGDLNGAASSLERAQRIAPREPQVLYRLAEVRLVQGDAAQAEQFARRGLTYANGRQTLQAGLWNIIAKARESQGDTAGANEARQRARVGS